VQEDQKVTWCQDDGHYVSSLEKECEQKDTTIGQLRNQLDTLRLQQQQQQVNDAARMMYPANDTSNTDVRQKLMQFEMDIRAKRLEVEELRAKVHFLCGILKSFSSRHAALLDSARLCSALYLCVLILFLAVMLSTSIR